MAVQMKEESFAGTGGKIAYRSWLPEGAPKAVIVFCHGFNAHSGYFGWPGEKEAARGYAVYAADLRGRGKSDGTPRFYIDDIAEYTSDLGGMVKLAKSRHPGLKVILMGHSAGGVTAVVYALDNQKELAGLVCISFAYRVPAPMAALNLIGFVSRFLPKLPILALKNSDFSRDKQHVARMDADPLIKNEKQPAKTLFALGAAGARMHRDFPTMTIPVLIMHGSEDHATLPIGSQEFFDRAGSKDKQLKIYPGNYHDLLNDVGKEQVLADIDTWIDQHV
ncbi:MAG TPA: lysophospholipase [Bauldia sp.]|nr:lysophospholipase [Bauldia sp.]